ncbi:hypothetical protein [Reinekea sp.]|uniref:hypothetical protein n=1 Tax=Reinekea sp. TaxID=1970455 RepID=UPI002A825515|nr:hypothetical protein [Reinekea sp.]
MNRYLRLALIGFIFFAVLAAGYGVYRSIENDSPVTAYIVGVQDAETLSTDTLILLNGKKIPVQRVRSFSRIAKIINDKFGSDESQCIQKILDSSTDPVGLVIESLSLIKQYILIEATNLESLNKLSKSDLSGTKEVGEFGIEHGKKMRLILDGFPAALRPMEELFKCTKNLKGWLIYLD